MPYNGSGVFAVYTPGNPVVTGTTISSTVQNNTMSDFATGLSTCITKDGQTTVTADIPMAAHKITGLAAGTASTDAANLSNIQSQSGVYVATVGGTADAITLAPAPAIAAYATGQRFAWIASGTNTGAVTVAVSGLTAKAITKLGSTALAAGDIVSGALCIAQYDGTRFQLLNIQSVAMTNTANIFTETQTITSTDSGAAGAPIFTLYRNSATPAANDIIGYLSFLGEDSSGSTEAYANIATQIVDPTATSEDSRVVVQTVVSGVFSNRAFIGAGFYTSNATGGDQGANTINASEIYDDGVQIRPITIATEQASTSGTSIDFTSIPAGVKRIKVMFNGVSTNGTSPIIIQLGDAGGVEPTGYVAASLSSGGNSTFTAGFGTAALTAADVIYGCVTLDLMNAASFTWGASGVINTASIGLSISGRKSTSAVVDRVRITTVGGTDTFDAGAINIAYE